jgi:hypothetical protein
VLAILSGVAQTDSPCRARKAQPFGTHEHDALIFYNALITPFVVVLTERPVSPRDPALARPAKQGCGNKRTRKALLIKYELGKHRMRSSVKLRKEMETGKQSGVAFPAGPCRVKHGRRNTRKRSKNIL